MIHMGRPAKTEAPKYGKHLASLRLAAGLSQQQIADVVEVRQSTVASWERSARPPKGDFLPLLAKTYKVSLSTLIQCEESLSADRHRGPASRLEKLLAEAHKLPRRRQKRIADTLELLIQQEVQAS